MAWEIRDVPIGMIVILCLSSCDIKSKSIEPLRYDSAGIVVVRHGALAQYDRRVHRAEYLFTTGVSDESSDPLFGAIGDAAVLSDGTLAVLDLQAAEVRLFSPDDERVRTIGRRGGGPGELSGDGTLALLPLASGRFAIPDLMNQSVSVYDGISGDLLNSHKMAEEVVYLPEWQSFSGDTVAVRTQEGGHESVVTRNLDGSWSDTLVSVERVKQAVSKSDPRTPLLPDHWVWAISITNAHDLALARLSTPAVQIYGDSRLRLHIIWDAPEAELSEQEIDHLIGIVGRRLGIDGQNAAAMRRRVTEVMAVPNTAPVLANLVFGPEDVLLAGC